MVVLMRSVVVFALLLAGPAYAQENAHPSDRTIKVTAERYHFTPSKIKLKVGEAVVLVLTSLDTDHGFRIPHANINATIPPKGKGELRIRFRPTEKGKYWYESSVPSGAGYSLMRGVIKVHD